MSSIKVTQYSHEHHRNLPTCDHVDFDEVYPTHVHLEINTYVAGEVTAVCDNCHENFMSEVFNNTYECSHCPIESPFTDLTPVRNDVGEVDFICCDCLERLQDSGYVGDVVNNVYPE